MGLRVAVVGCGYWGAKHSRVLRALDEVDAVVHVDVQERSLAALARQWPGTAAYTSLQDALPSVDAVVVATPPTTHVPLALTALAAGRHVLVEKPLAVSARGARRLVEAADRAGRVLMVGHTFEYDPAVAALRRLVAAGELGELLHVSAERLNLGRYQSDVNVIADLAAHDVSIANHLLGRPPVAVEAWGSAHAGRSMEDIAYLRLHYGTTPLTFNIHVSWLDPRKVRRMTLVGDRKMAVWDGQAGDGPVRVHDMGLDAGDSGDSGDVAYRIGATTSPVLPVEEPLAVQDRHFVRSALRGTRPRTDGRNGLAVVEVLEALQLALREGRRVTLDEVRTRPGRAPVVEPGAVRAVPVAP